MVNPQHPDFWVLRGQNLGPLFYEKIAIQGEVNYSTQLNPVHKTYYFSYPKQIDSSIFISCFFDENDPTRINLEGQNPLFADFQQMLTEKKFLNSPAGKLKSVFLPGTGHALFDSIKMDLNGW